MLRAGDWLLGPGGTRLGYLLLQVANAHLQLARHFKFQGKQTSLQQAALVPTESLESVLGSTMCQELLQALSLQYLSAQKGLLKVT